MNMKEVLNKCNSILESIKNHNDGHKQNVPFMKQNALELSTDTSGTNKWENVHLGFCGDVVTDCCHGVHPVAIDTLIFSDRPMLTMGQKEEVCANKSTLNTHI